jgi:hypothetical protein
MIAPICPTHEGTASAVGDDLQLVVARANPTSPIRGEVRLRHSTTAHERLMLTVLGGLAECKLPNSKPDPIRSIKIPSKYSYQTNSY